MHSKIIQEIRDDYSPEKNTERTLRGYATSIKTLAEDLYAKDTHFIFELIQNAEDNDYEVDTPSLRFVLTKTDSIIGGKGKTVLIVENNEVGFQKENVEAICSVGRSTKIKDQGYIGEKGIGFKSVFRVTSCPYIFSRGFRFSLPEKDEFSGLGYIVPTWQQGVPKNLDDKITSIYLPLNKSDFSVNKVANSLKDVAPETIIFLKKLKTIELIINFEKQYEIIIEKDDSEFPLVKLTYLKKNEHEEKIIEQLFWVASKEFIKPAEITHEKRQKINSRDVSIAIPLLGKQEGKLFAYLPVWENTRLPFLINADFLLTSSREAVKEGEPWNEWLRSCIAEVYVEALISCLSTHDLPFEQKISSYASLPRRTNQNFLQPIIPAIQEQLRKTLCVYTAQCDVLAIPHTTRIAPKEFWGLLSGNSFPDALQEHVQLVCPKLEPYNKRLIDIGASHLAKENIVKCLEDSYWLSDKSNEWFVQLYRYLKKYNIENESLVTKKIIKTWSDTELKTFLSCSADQPIYFERDDNSRTIIKDVPEWLHKIIPVSFLNREFWEYLSRQEDSVELMEWMTEHLQIHPFSKTNYCINILNVLLEKYELLSPKRIAAVTAFLAVHADDDFDQWHTLPIVFNNGEKDFLYKFINSISIVVPECYDRNTGWQHIWATDTDRQHFSVLSNYYRPETIDHLLSHCGNIIKKYPTPERVEKITYGAGNEYEEKCILNAPRSTYQKTITNWRPPSPLKQEAIEDKLISESLLSFLSQGNLRYYKFSIVNYFYYSSKTSQRDSEFVSRIKNCKWLPTQKGFVRPAQAFLPKKEIKEILGETVPYFQGKLPEDVIRGLGIKDELTIEELLGTVKDYSGETNVNHEMVYRIYSAIDTKTRFDGAESISSLFKKQNLIFVPTEKDYGQWYALENVIWEDSEKILGDDFTYLEKHYPKLKDFFLNTLGVKEKADPESFAQRWLRIQEDAKKSSQEKRKIMDPIYRVLLPIAKRKNDERPDWWDGFVAEALFLTQEGEFVDTDELVVPDDGELKRIFSGTDTQFVWRPEKDSFNQWAPFYEAFGIPRISESVQGGLAEEADFVKTECNELITPSMIAMLASWLRERDDRHYSALLQDGMFQKLRDLCEAGTDKEIKIVFTMEAGYLYEKVEWSYPVFWDHNKDILIIDRSAGPSSIKRKVSVEIAKGLMSNRAYKDLAHWIELILGADDTDRVQAEGWPVPREISKLLKKDSEQPGSNTQKKKSKSRKTDKDGNKSGESDPPKHEKDSERNEQNRQDNANVHDNAKRSQGDVKKQQGDNPSYQDNNGKHSTERPGGETQADKSEEIEDENSADNVIGNASLSETIIEKFNMAFNRDGETTLSGDIEDEDFYNEGNVKKPGRRRDKLRALNKNRIINEPTQDQRRRETISNILEPADPATREYLLNLYSGKCQICEETFPQRNGTPFFIVSHIVERKHARLLDNPANALSLCPLHFAQWRHGTVEADNILEQVLSNKTRSEGGEENVSLQIELCGKKCEISYKEKHIVDLQALLTEVINFGNKES